MIQNSNFKKISLLFQPKNSETFSNSLKYALFTPQNRYFRGKMIQQVVKNLKNPQNVHFSNSPPTQKYKKPQPQGLGSYFIYYSSLPYRVTSFFRYVYLSFACSSFSANSLAAFSGLERFREL